MVTRPIHRIVNLIVDDEQHVLNMSLDEARRLLLSEDRDAVRHLKGSFALVASDGARVCLARSLSRPLRYFLAKESRSTWSARP